MPGFSNGWLTAFKQRHNLHQSVRHGEAGVFDHEQLKLDLATIQEELQAYDNNSIYNMDKTALLEDKPKLYNCNRTNGWKKGRKSLFYS